jgi:uncharacterized Zn finger protein
MTKKTKKDESVCPHCGSSNIQHGVWERDGDGMYALTECEDCDGERWYANG